MNRQALTFVSVVLFAGALVLAWATQGTGVVTNDSGRGIHIPDELTIPLQVKVAYDGENIYFRYRWPAPRPHLYIDMLRYEQGEWIRYGRSPVGPEPHGVYEDRVTMLVDDGSVPEFGRYGGYVAVGSGMRFFHDQASRQQVSAHPYLGQEKSLSDIRKHLPATRRDINDWTSVVDAETLAAQRQAGYFLDLWHWRSHRSNPIGVADDQFVAEHRFGDSGRGPYFTNWDGENNRPLLMFDPQKTGGLHALRWEDVTVQRANFEETYYLHETQAKPFDPEYSWQEGDVIPRRALREPEGSRGAIRVHGEGRWHDGHWDVTLVRAMDTGSPLDDKVFRDQGVYDVGFAVHRMATGSRWHYVSLPYRVGLGRDAEIRAVRVDGSEPDWNQPWHEVRLFYPGQVNWPLLNSRYHAGAGAIAKGVPVKVRHTEHQLSLYGVEMEFKDAIIAQWQVSIVAGVLLIAGFGYALMILIGRQEESAQ
jgi:hypothetical protein